MSYVVAVLHGGDRTVAVETPDFVQDRFQARCGARRSPRARRCASGEGASRPRSGAGGAFFERCLLAPWDRPAHAVGAACAACPSQAHEIGPAQIHADRAPQSLAHPRRHGAPEPVLALGRRSTHRLGELRQLLSAQERRRAMRVRVAPIAHRLRALPVVAAHHLPDPIARVARALGYLCGRVSFAQEPQDLPPTPLVRALRCPIALPDSAARARLPSNAVPG